MLLLHYNHNHSTHMYHWSFKGLIYIKGAKVIKVYFIGSYRDKDNRDDTFLHLYESKGVKLKFSVLD